MTWSELITNPWIGFIGTAFGFVSIVFTIVFYLRSRRFQAPSCYSFSINWFDDRFSPHGDIKLTFKGNVIPRFTITHLVFWNAGNQTIRQADFAAASPLRLIIPPQTQLFDLGIIGTTAPEINASITLPADYSSHTGADIPINFDYLDENDGFTVRAIHDSSSTQKINIVGKLPGVRKFQYGGSFVRQVNGSQPIAKFEIPISSPYYKYFIIPVASFTLGAAGAWSIYSLMFRDFHWYHIIASFFVVYLVVPFLILTTKSDPPRALLESLIYRPREE